MNSARVRLLSLVFFLLAISHLLLGAEKDRDAESEDPAGWESEAPEITGLNLIVSDLPDTSFPLDVMRLHSGEWWLRQRLDDRPMLLESRRLPAAEFDAGMPERLITLEWPLAREITVAPFPELAKKLSYPALKAEFMDGENEDARQFVAALIFTDGWSFWYVLEVPADAEPLLADAETGDAGTLNALLKREMKTILLGIEAADPTNGDFLPGPGLPAYESGAAAPDSPSLMDAIIRVKKLVNPENRGHWGGSARLAYRHDGAGEVAGSQALLLAFGGDSREKFTAERHFAVDGTGAVYEMNPVEGAAYRHWDERLQMWAGAFQKGGLFSGVWRAEDGERYVLHDDGTFVYTPSQSGAVERVVRKTGTWRVVNSELRLEIGARWILPVGGVQNILPGDGLSIVDGEVVKMLHTPPEAEPHSIARADAVPETGRAAVMIDGVLFYAGDDQPGFMDTSEN